MTFGEFLALEVWLQQFIELRAPKEFQGGSLEQRGLRTPSHVNLVALKSYVIEKQPGGRSPPDQH
jgi:hypothetical protein